jgi:G3E family GTPase
VVDTKHISQHWDAEEAKEQIAFADVILLNKTDLVTPEELDRLEQKIRGMNAIAKIYRTQNSELPMEAVLGVQAFNLDNALELDPNFLDAIKSDHHEDHQDHHDHDHHDDHHHHPKPHHHDEAIGSVALTAKGAMDGEKINNWLRELLQTQGGDIFRMKGIVNVAGEENRFVFQGVHMLFDGTSDRPWQPTETRKNELVFIGRNLDPEQLREGFHQCLV